MCVTPLMACLGTTTRNKIKAKIARLKSQLESLENTLDEAFEKGIESYSFDSGEGKQSTKYRSLEDLQKSRDKIEAELDYLYRRLNGGNIVNMNLRRRRYDRTARYI